MAFTDKQQAFIDFKVAGATQEEAAASAGYARSSASVTGSKLMKRSDIRNAVAKGKREIGGLKPLGRPRVIKDEPDDDDAVPEALKLWALKDRYSSPLELLIDVMNNKKAPGGLRIQCAKDAMPYCHARKEGSKKQDDKDAAKSTNAKSKFGTGRAPSHLQRVA